MPISGIFEFGFGFMAALVYDVGAARVKPTALGRLGRTRYIALENNPLSFGFNGRVRNRNC